MMTLLIQIQKGFRTAGAQVRRFGKDVSHFIGSKVLPVVGKIASGVSQGIKYAMSGEILMWYLCPVPSAQDENSIHGREEINVKPQALDVQHLLKRSNNLVRITTSD